MTVYELAKSLPDETRRLASKAGILSPNIERYMYIYELYTEALARGVSKMSAYELVSQKCFTSMENLRKIIRKMSSDVR